MVIKLPQKKITRYLVLVGLLLFFWHTNIVQAADQDWEEDFSTCGVSTCDGWNFTIFGNSTFQEASIYTSAPYSFKLYNGAATNVIGTYTATSSLQVGDIVSYKVRRSSFSESGNAYVSYQNSGGTVTTIQFNSVGLYYSCAGCTGGPVASSTTIDGSLSVDTWYTVYFRVDSETEFSIKEDDGSWYTANPPATATSTLAHLIEMRFYPDNNTMYVDDFTRSGNVATSYLDQLSPADGTIHTANGFYWFYHLALAETDVNIYDSFLVQVFDTYNNITTYIDSDTYLSSTLLAYFVPSNGLYSSLSSTIFTSVPNYVGSHTTTWRIIGNSTTTSDTLYTASTTWTFSDSIDITDFASSTISELFQQEFSFCLDPCTSTSTALFSTEVFKCALLSAGAYFICPDQDKIVGLAARVDTLKTQFPFNIWTETKATYEAALSSSSASIYWTGLEFNEAPIEILGSSTYAKALAFGPAQQVYTVIQYLIWLAAVVALIFLTTRGE